MIPFYPASYGLDNIIAVAATDLHDNLAFFSNYGAGSVHVAAPGVNIYSTRSARQTLWRDDFDDGNVADWTTGGTNNTWGLSSSKSFSGAFSMAVNPLGNYLNNSNSWAQAPALDLAAAAGSKLSFVFTGRSQLNRDFLFVETSTDGSAWTNRTVYVMNSSGADIGAFANGISGDSAGQWYHGVVDLGNHDGQSSVHVRFHFTSNGTVNDVGWFIDNLAVTAAATTYSGSSSDYRYMSGTSMATPHVAGLAALIWGFKPDLSYLQIKDIILNSVDARSSLTGKTLSGGRINALNALYHVTPQAPGPLAAAPLSASAIELAWSESSLNEFGFRIERKTQNGAYAFITTADKDTVGYSDTGLRAGTYCYRISSFNHGGNSDYSNEACATTSGAVAGGEPAARGDEPVVSGGDGIAGDGRVGCFIATAAFDSPLAGLNQVFRKFHDRFLKMLRLDVAQGPDNSGRLT